MSSAAQKRFRNEGHATRPRRELHDTALDHKLDHLTISKMSLGTPKRSFDNFIEPDALPSATSPKRARAAESHLWGSQLWDMIVKLPQDTTNAILFNACQNNAAASAAIQAAHQEQLAQLANAPAVNFDSYSRNCWHTLNTQYARMRPSKQSEAVSDILDVLSDSRDAILAAAGPETRWETRRNALEVMRKIAKSIMMCDEQQIKHELMADTIELNSWADAMVEIARGMSEQERDMYKGEGFYEKLVNLQTECEWETDMEGLREVYEIFDGEGDGDSQEREEDEGDEEDDDQNDEDEVKEIDAETYDNYAHSTIHVSSRAKSDPPAPPPPRRTSVFSIGDML